MKIGMILDAPFPPDYRVEKEALTLVENGHEVLLFCIDYKKDTYEELYKGIRLVHYKSNKLEYKLSALAYTFPFYHWLMEIKLKKFFKKYRPDVVHVHDMVIAGAVLPLAGKMGIRTVLDLHENRPEIMKEYLHLQKFPGKYLIDLDIWKRKQINLAKHADHVVVVTDLAKQIIEKEADLDSGRVIVLPNTPTLNFLTYPIDSSIMQGMSGKFNLLYIGDTSERRGTEDLLKVIDLLRNYIPEICIWLIGTSSFDNKLKDLSKKLGVEEFIQFEGWQPEKLFPSYITGAHVCLSPLKRNLHHDTTFANKVFQYMALGKPVVVSDCPAQAELVTRENCGLVHEAGNIKSFSQCIVKLFEDESLREAMGNNARKAVVTKWNWELTSLPLVELYKHLKI